jgi:hypothetical protein
MTRAQENSEPVYSCTSTTRPSAPYEGQFVYETDTKTVSIYDGSAWIKWAGAITTTAAGGATVASHFGNGPFAMSSGNVTITPPSASYGLVSITFPTSRFTIAPLVQVSLSSAVGGTQRLVPRANAITTSGCDIYCYTGDATTWSTGNQVVNWLAVQMTSGSKEG